MQIAYDRFGFEAVETAKVIDSVFEGVTRFECLQVADMLADENILPNADGNRVLQVSADSEHRRHVSQHSNSQRRVSASTAQNSSASACEAHDRVVTGPHDGSIVHQEMIGNVFQASSRFFVSDRDGFIAAVAAGS